MQGCTPSIPRRCGRQTQRSNVQAETPEEYYRRSLTIPFIDHMISHIATRFSNLQEKASMALTIVPSVLLQSNTSGTSITNLVDFFREDLPSPSTIDQEIHLWRCKWQNFTGQVPDSPREALVHATEVMFPNVSILLRLICTLPVTSCECERSISVLRRLKTYLRTTMGQERLTGLALMHVHYATEIDLDEVINIFARQHPRRMLLENILH